jgi:hypothetical protein
MDETHLVEIRNRYAASAPDAAPLFRQILAAAEEMGMEEALAALESCVFERRARWLDNHPDLLQKGANPVGRAYHLFFERYLGLSVPRDGELVESSETKITVRWHNRCPTLDACVKLGLDTRQVCRLTYERPVQMMLERLDPRLRFVRNYEAVRPHVRYCEESIELVEG